MSSSEEEEEEWDEETYDELCIAVEVCIEDANDYFYNGRKDSIFEKAAYYQDLAEMLRRAQDELREMIVRFRDRDLKRGLELISYG